jgi:gluconolactonase
MKSKMMLLIILCLSSALALGLPAVQQRGQRGEGPLPQTPAAQEKLPRNVTITEIPGVIAAGAKWEQVWQGADNGDGLVGTPDGGVLFAQEQPSIVRKLDQNGMDSAFVRDTHGAGSIGMDSQGRIIAVQRTCTDPGRAPLPCNEPTKVAIIYPEKDRKVLTDNFQGKPYGRLSDIVVARNGTVYFTGSTGYSVTPSGQVMSLGDDIRANGIQLSPDEKTVYVTNGGVVVALDIQPNGTVTNRRDFAKLPKGSADGLAVDGAGRLYAATNADGVQVFSPEGKYLGTIPTPRNAITLAFSGPGKKTLYIVGGGALHPNGTEFLLAPGLRNNAKTIYKISMLAEGNKSRAK